MRPFTVIYIHTEHGQICADHVLADNGMAAFHVVAMDYPDGDIDFVAVLEGDFAEGENIHFPGNSLVDSATVLEQPEVFS